MGRRLRGVLRAAPSFRPSPSASCPATLPYAHIHARTTMQYCLLHHLHSLIALPYSALSTLSTMLLGNVYCRHPRSMAHPVAMISP